MEQMFSPKVKLFNSPPVTPKKQLSVNFALDTIFKDSDFENDENRENIRSIENREIDTWEGEDVDRQMDREFFEQTFGPSPRPKHYPSKHRPVDLGDVCTSHLTPERTSNPTDIDCELRARLQVIRC